MEALNAEEKFLQLLKIAFQQRDDIPTLAKLPNNIHNVIA
jgi:hypothetical protein